MSVKGRSKGEIISFKISSKFLSEKKEKGYGQEERRKAHYMYSRTFNSM